MAPASFSPIHPCTNAHVHQRVTLRLTNSRVKRHAAPKANLRGPYGPKQAFYDHAVGCKYPLPPQVFRPSEPVSLGRAQVSGAGAAVAAMKEVEKVKDLEVSS